MLPLDDRPLADDQGVLQDVLQLPDVARIIVVEEHLHGLFRDPVEPDVAFGAELFQDVGDEQGQVLPPFLEARQFQPHDVEPVEKILTEFPLPDLPLQPQVGGRDDPDIHLGGFAAAQGVELFILQHRQELGLEGQGQVADLVQEDGAAVGLLEATGLVLVRAGEGPFDVAEHLGFQQVLRQGRAVDLDQGLVGPVAGGVDHLGQNIFARAGLPLHEHRGVAFGDHRQDPEDLLHGRRLAHHVVEGVPVPHGAVELVDQGKIGEGGQPAHDAARLVVEGHVVGPDGEGQAVPGDQGPFLP